MSATGQIRDLVDAAVAVFHRKNAEQDKRLDQIEKRLDALETPPPSAAKKTTAAPAAKAQAGTAAVKGKASSS
jgi:hypothetical protein